MGHLETTGKINRFYIFAHTHIVFFLLWVFFIVQYPQSRTLISILSGSVGLIPFLVHKVIVNKKEHFNKPISNILIFGNMFAGIVLIVIGIFDK